MPPRPAVGLKKLELLSLSRTQVTDAGCATLAAAIKSGALPAPWSFCLSGIPASAAAKEAVYDARLRGAAPQHFGGYWDDPEVVPYGGHPSGAPDDGGYADGYYEPDDGY